MTVVVDSKRREPGFNFGSVRGWAAGLGGAAVLALLGYGGYLLFSGMSGPPNVPDVVAKVTQSVVQVTCGDAMGTGVVMNVDRPDGVGAVVISAAHVFDACAAGDAVGVVFDGRALHGRLVAKDPETSLPIATPDKRVDLARVEVTESLPGLDAAPLARVGDWAIVVGNPLDHVNYASFGIVSSVNPAYYETTAPVNEGNSGGPMVDAQGRVLGIISTTTLKNALYEGNADTVVDQAAGMAQVMRLSRACGTIYPSGPCPFTD